MTLVIIFFAITLIHLIWIYIKAFNHAKDENEAGLIMVGGIWTFAIIFMLAFSTIKNKVQKSTTEPKFEQVEIPLYRKI